MKTPLTVDEHLRELLFEQTQPLYERMRELADEVRVMRTTLLPQAFAYGAGFNLEAARTRKAVPPEYGPRLYMIQVMPEFAPQRIKLGWSGDLKGRLRSYQTSSPTARLIAVRPGDRMGELTLLECFSKAAMQLCKEVFDVYNLDAAVELFHATELRWGDQ